MRSLLIMLMVLSLAACGEDNPVRKAINEQSFDITLADYKEGTPEDRTEFIQNYMTRQALPEADLPLYINCMGDYAVTKSKDLAFPDIFSWCQGDAERDRPAFEDHFNELDAADLYSEAKGLCERYVETKLSAPATADFPLFARHSAKGRWRYAINSYVDAQNLYGAKVRMNFICDLQYTGPDNGKGFSDAYLDYRNWIMHDFEIR